MKVCVKPHTTSHSVIPTVFLTGGPGQTQSHIMMVGGTGFGSGSAEDFSVECQQTSLEAVGIGSAFHDRLISAGLDLETLQMAAVDRQSLYSLLKEAGISRPGDRVRIVNSVLRKSLFPPNLLHGGCTRRCCWCVCLFSAPVA